MALDYKNMLVGVCIPGTDRTFPSEFCDSFFCIGKPSRTVYIRPKGAGPLDHIRNELVLMAQKMMCTHVWMADTDQIYPQDVLMKLLAADLPVVAAKVHRRYPPYDPLLLRGSPGSYKSVPEAEWTPGGLVEVDATGCGSILYNMEVFDKIPYPWFEFHFENKANPVGEDVDFCQKLRKAGIPIHVDCGIEIGHMSLNIITVESYWAYKYSQNTGPQKVQTMTLPRKKDPRVDVEWDGETDKAKGEKDGSKNKK